MFVRNFTDLSSSVCISGYSISLALCFSQLLAALVVGEVDEACIQ